MKKVLITVLICLISLSFSKDVSIECVNQELIPVFPNSSFKPYVNITFNKSTNFIVNNRLAIVSAKATYEPYIGKEEENKTVENLIETFERNFINFGYNVVERLKVNKVLEELSLSMTGIVEEDTALEAGKLLSAQVVAFIDILISGELPEHSYVKISFKIIDVQTGSILVSGISMNTTNGVTKLVEKLSDEYLNYWGIQHNQIGRNYSEQNKIDSALTNYNLSLVALDNIKYKSIENYRWIGIVHNNIGALYKQDKQWRNSIEWLNKSIEFNKAIDKNNPVLANTYRHLCELYLENKDYKNSEVYGQKGLDICSANKDMEQECKILKLMLKGYEEDNDTNGYETIKKRMGKIFCK